MKKLEDRKLSERLVDLQEELTPMQIKFAHALVDGENIKSATQCAKEAGYSEKTARNMAYKLQKESEFPKVAQYIRELREDMYNIYKISKNSFYRRMHTLGMKAEQDGNVGKAIEAERERGKVAGLYNHTKTVNVGTIDNMSLEQVQKMIDNLRPQVTIDMTPEKVVIEESGSETIQSDDQSEQGVQQISE